MTEKLVVLWSNSAFVLALSPWAQYKRDFKKTQGGIRSCAKLIPAVNASLIKANIYCFQIYVW